MTTTSEPPPSGGRERGGKPLPLQIELPSSVTAAPSERREREGTPRASRIAIARGAGALFGLLLIVGCLVVWGLPAYVRRECIAQAATHGIVLTIERAKVGGAGFRLVGASATFADVPGAHARAAEIEIETNGLAPKRMTVRGAELNLDGRWSSVDAAFGRWRASPTGGQAGAWAPASLLVLESHVVWNGSVGEDTRLEAAKVRIEVAWHEDGAEVEVASEHVTVDAQGGRLGPWAIHLARSPRRSRLRVALDPDVPESCTVLLMTDSDRVTSFDAMVRRSPMARLGLPPAAFGLRGDDAQLEATVHYATLGPHRGNASAKGTLFSINAVEAPHPIDVALEATASGDPDVGMEVKNARLAVGPLVGPLTGILKTFGDAFRVELGWAAGPVPCAAFEAPLGPGQPFDVAYPLRMLAEAAARRHVAAHASAGLSMAFDSRDPWNGGLVLSAPSTCERAKVTH